MDLHVLIIVYDITNRKSFQNLDFWYKEVKGNGYDELFLMLVGTKKDKNNKRVVREREVAQWLRGKGLKSLETSSKDGTNIKRLISDLCSLAR